MREQLSAQFAHGVATTRRLKEELTQQAQRTRMQLKDIQTKLRSLQTYGHVSRIGIRLDYRRRRGLFAAQP